MYFSTISSTYSNKCYCCIESDSLVEMYLLSSMCCCFCHWSSNRLNFYCSISMEWILPSSIWHGIFWQLPLCLLQQSHTSLLSHECNNVTDADRLQHSLPSIHLPYFHHLLHHVRHLNAEAWWEWNELNVRMHILSQHWNRDSRMSTTTWIHNPFSTRLLCLLLPNVFQLTSTDGNPYPVSADQERVHQEIDS